ncbi:alcohol dehydrogenase catalytic domain-containing protein [Oceanobacillus piezotolerans]|nr:hypothetical protein [Oceanobacillus piezotolerans]
MAAAVNRTDIVNRESSSGYLHNPILGVEVAGIVEEAGAGAEIATGTKVMGLVNGGGYASGSFSKFSVIVLLRLTLTAVSTLTNSVDGIESASILIICPVTESK